MSSKRAGPSSATVAPAGRSAGTLATRARAWARARGQHLQQRRGAQVVVRDVVGDVTDVEPQADHRGLVA
ncbi:hypothetical protein ACVU7I_08295, partial [Patulibacter sp. S7RM1-6]